MSGRRLGRAGVIDDMVLEEGRQVLAYPELGMEAIFKITVKDFPAFIIVDDKGNDFFEKIAS